MNARAALDLLLEDPDTVIRGGKSYDYRNKPQQAFLLVGQGAVGSLKTGLGHHELLKTARAFGRTPVMAKHMGLVWVGDALEDILYLGDDDPRDTPTIKAGRVFPTANVVTFWGIHYDIQPLMPVVTEIVRLLGHDPVRMDYEFGDSKTTENEWGYQTDDVEFMTYAQACGQTVKDVSPEERKRVELLQKAHFDAQARAELDRMDPQAAKSRALGAGSMTTARNATRAGFANAAAYNNARRLGDSLFTD